MAAKEVLYEIFYMKAPGQDRLRKSADGRLRYLLREGWHEVAREPMGPDSVRIRFEREGFKKPLEPLRKVVEPPPRRRREGGRGGPPQRR